jgi:hypothetical protein
MSTLVAERKGRRLGKKIEEDRGRRQEEDRKKTGRKQEEK